MFSTHRQLERRTGKSGTPRKVKKVQTVWNIRLEYLQQLVNEYQDTKDQEAKYQVLANLVNFSYDPINYNWLWQLNVVDLFLDTLTESDEKLKEFGLGGLCNLCLEKRNKEHIINNDGIPLIIQCLYDKNEEIILSAITTLMFLDSKENEDILSESVKKRLEHLSQFENKRLNNLVTIFLQDYFKQTNFDKTV
ncbi:2281_t:CDS:2 [Scutellospora calospora]|uniref:2281_t:CDS:1 n=1 Tax=Scutellospora calospora TaxID=85575 RepID=A0ACA9KS85_9GLOM|nr:2281_t:CDS:2 [Scutellospora calospora]